MTDTTDRDILLGAVEEFCEKRVRDSAWVERASIVKHIRECAALPSMRAHRPEVAEALAALATEIEEGEHVRDD